MSREVLKSHMKWVRGQSVWVEHQPMIEKREADYIATVKHRTIKKLEPSKWGGDGAAQ